jgi:non-specific serine/threonine protein kinase
LTPREWEVARLVAAGSSNLEIATALHITERTVEHHVAHILDKLGVPSRVQIATWVVKQRLDSSSGHE